MGFDGESLSSINFNYQIKRGYILTYVCIHAFYGAFFVFYTAQNTAYAKEENLFSEGAAELLQRFLHLQWEQMEGFLVSREALLMLEALLLSYVEHHIERPLRSTAFIRQVAALGNA